VLFRSLSSRFDRTSNACCACRSVRANRSTVRWRVFFFVLFCLFFFFLFVFFVFMKSASNRIDDETSSEQNINRILSVFTECISVCVCVCVCVLKKDQNDPRDYRANAAVSSSW
jgi:Na+/H+ antiporter NhaD/arsenite permease-like protein